MRLRPLATMLLMPMFLACAGAARQAPAPADMPTHQHGAGAEIRVPEGALYTVADVSFLQGMIAHHAQAIHMSHLS